MPSSSSSSDPALTCPPPPVPDTLVTFPSAHVLLVTLNRPKQLNAIPTAGHFALTDLWAWYDAQPALRCAVITGAGRAFCAGADLREWNDNQKKKKNKAQNTAAGGEEAKTRTRTAWAKGGFGGLSNRVGKKPVVAAVNGPCFGGGMEMVINCDLVLAARGKAVFGLPEVGKGVVAIQGALARLVRVVGRQRASEMALLGRTGYGAEEMKSWGLVNFVIGEGGDVVEEAVKVAEEMARNSPDAVIVSREGLRLGWEPIGPYEGTEALKEGMYDQIDGGANMLEGVGSFVERRKPKWLDSKL